MITVKPLAHGFTMLSVLIEDECGGRMWRGNLVDPEGYVACWNTYSKGDGKPFVDFQEVFGRLGYRTIPQESIYYHAANHAARM